MVKYHVNMNLAALKAVLQSSIQRTTDIVSFGLISSDKITGPETLELPGTFVHVSPATNLRLDFESAKSEFKKWALVGGIRDCIEAINTFLDKVRPICFFCSAGSLLTGEVWNTGMSSNIRRKFHNLGLPGKVNFLVTEYDPSLRPELTDEVLSINRARNCMVHRNGIVSALDLNSDEGLLVRWRKMQVIAKGSHGQRVVTGEDIVKAGEGISVQQAASQKLFLPGESISFTTDEFSELCFTTMLFGMQLVDNIDNYARAKGIPFNSTTEEGIASN